MTEIILSSLTASISELKANPMQIVESAGGESIAILNRNKPAFYCVPAKIYEAMLEAMDDLELTRIVRAREGEEEIEMAWDAL